jgi:hypothetical protein
MRRRYLCGALVGVLVTAVAVSAGAGRSASVAHPSSKLAKPSMMRIFKGKPAARLRGSNNLAYHGGVGGIGVETAPKVYVVYWGSQWSSDPSGEKTIVQNFMTAVGGSPWLNSVTQYCQGVASGTTTCPSGGQHAGNPAGILGGTWSDSGSAAPQHPTQSQLAGEAINAMAHFSPTPNHNTAQFVIATAHNNNASGFGTSYCAWHSSTSSSYGNVAYTNLPYITDAGAACGANFNGLGPNAGITIVEGHEMAETITDQFPNGGWLDRNGEENGDKCAWTSGTSNQQMGGSSFPVQPLWSNASSSCVVSY